MRKLTTEELQRISVEEFKQTPKIPVVLVLDNVRSMHNIGSVFRTADAFSVEKIYLCGITAQPPHREIQKTALGATDSVVWEYVAETSQALENLKKQNFTIVALEQTNESVFLQDFEADKSKKYAFVFGNEVVGVEQTVIDACKMAVEIPQFGTKHSFNVSVTVGIVLWDYVLKTKK
jgi:tRNA G18 (ribose-2'-O)-methylase SpoU